MSRHTYSRWWLVPAIVVGVLLWAALFSAAYGADTYAWNAETRVTIQPSSKPGAVAEVVFLNTGIHLLNTYSFQIDLEGLAVSVTVEINTEGAADTMTVTPPEGYIAVPESVTVPEDGAGQIIIYEGGLS
jgi:hypothetical protein